MKKIEKEEVEKYLKSHGNWNLLSDYIGNHTPIIICNDLGYKASPTFANFKTNDNIIIFGKKNPYYKENIKCLLSKKSKEIEFIDAIPTKKGGKHRIFVKMKDENGHIFQKDLDHVLSDKYLCCAKCARKRKQAKDDMRHTKKWLSEIDFIRYEIIEPINKITSETYIDVEDKETGYRFCSNVRSIVKKNMQPFNIYSNKKYYLYNLSVYAENNGLLSKPIEIKDATTSKVLFQCKCGKTFVRNVNKWADGRDLCPSCSKKQSSYERIFEQYLKENNIAYKTEYRFNDCRSIYPLPFDFYLQDYDCLIEIDGMQHYQPVNFGGSGHEVDKRFRMQLEHDTIKDKYCSDKKIPLLRLSYLSFKDGSWKDKTIHFIKTLRSNKP